MRNLVLVLMLVAALALLGCGGAKDTGTPSSSLPQVREHQADAPANIEIEAESSEAIEAPMKVVDDKEASGGKCLTVPGDSGKPGAEIPGEPGKKYPDRWGAATYKFNCAEPAPYRFWGRKLWANGCGNSIIIRVNGGAPIEFGQDGVYDKWDWKACTVFFDLKSGENTLEVLNREPGVSLDKVIFTKDLDFIPQGTE